MAKEKMEALRAAALLTRFRTTEPTIKSRKYATYKTIAAALNLTPNEVQHICRKALQPQRALTGKQLVQKLGPEHVDFLISPVTLERWAGLTMKQRTVFFHRQFTDKRIAVTSLRRLYLKHGIRCKKVRQEKVMPPPARVDFVQRCRSLVDQIEHAKLEGRLIVYVDEINFTKRSLKLREWSMKNSNLTVNQAEVFVGYRSVVAAMTEEKGLGLIKIHDRACTGEDFRDYLKQLSQKVGRRPVALFMDNLRIHKKPCVKEWWPKLNMEPIWNVGYSPEFNPIEAVFSKVKRQFSCQRLHNLVNRKGFNVDTAIEAAFKTIEPAHCAACARKSLHLLERAANAAPQSGIQVQQP